MCVVLVTEEVTRTSLVKRRFDHLKVVAEIAQRLSDKKYIYRCQCDCGREVDRSHKALTDKRGGKRACHESGCKFSTKHQKRGGSIDHAEVIRRRNEIRDSWSPEERERRSCYGVGSVGLMVCRVGTAE